eukprot:TRINITY_DN12836_c0_g1_i1.p1 TRINITY_DN12836_c0_g1~~TRINITY_DN12836_c0_g1_i1.p1  ORF type:complete len:305 (-),score=38.13 TRINITY_DN12836_c0_g1_i1:71-985(-)
MSATTSNTKKPLSTPFWFGGAASCVAAFVTHPLDLTKVRMQMNENRGLGQGMFRTMVGIVKNEGVLAIYNGISASLLRQLTYSTVRFGTYDKMKEAALNFKKDKEGEQKKLGFWGLLVCAMASGALGGAVGNPADIVNVRMQNDGKLPVEQRRNYKHAFDGLVRMTREEGMSALARGIQPNVYRAMYMNAGQQVSYDIFKRNLLKTPWFKDNLTTHFLSSFLAGLVATTICAPIDVVKTRVMGSKEKITGGSLGMIAKVARNEGFFALFKGWVPAFIRLGPQTVLTFIFLEKMKVVYFKYKTKR